MSTPNVAAITGRRANPSWLGRHARSLFLLATLTLPAAAQLDSNSNGISDVWERHFNDGYLFDPENPAHAPDADPDGDGWTNLEESIAGTDPTCGNPPEGIIATLFTHLKDQEEAPTPEYPDGRLINLAIVSWDTLPGKRYTLAASPDLSAASWIIIGEPITGDGLPAAISITLTDTGGENPERLFWRVHVTDPQTDTDEDGLTDYEEYLLGSNPYAADTSGDGIPDKWLVVHGLNPNQHHANILFPNSDITAVDAFAIGVQDHPDANPEDLDGDGLANEIDAHPEDRPINWERASVSAYALIDLGWPESSEAGYHGSIVDFNDVGHVLLKDAVWVDGHWHPIEHQEVSGNAAWWGVDYTYQSEFNIGSSLMPDGGMIQAGEWTASGGPSDVMSVWHVGYMPYDQTTSGHGAFISTLSTLGPFINDKEISITPMGGDSSGRIFGRKSWYDLEHEICILNQNLEQIGAMEFPDNMRPSWTNSRVTPSGWVAVSAIATSQSQSHQTLVWNPDGIITSYENGHLPFYFQDIADLPNGNVALTYHQPVVGDQVFLVNNSTGSFRQSPTLSGKEILAFSGNGTAITNNHKIWLNGELVPLDDISMDYQDATNIGWSFHPIKGNANGSILMGGLNGADTTAALLHPVQIVSRDKFMAGSFRLPDGMDDLELEFVHAETGENLGRYGDLLGDGETNIYPHDTNILDDNDSISESEMKPVWFVISETGSRTIEFHMCFASTGPVEIRIHQGDYQVGAVRHELTEAEDFADIINRVSDWVSGTAFDLEAEQTPLMQNFIGMELVGMGGQLESQHPLVAVCTAPFFNILAQVEGMTIIVEGVMDGIIAGIKDDLEFLTFLSNGSVVAMGVPILLMNTELDLWINDPKHRATQLKSALEEICKEWILEPMNEIRKDLSTWNGFKDRAWKAWQFLRQSHQNLQFAHIVGSHVLITTIRNSLIEWGNDFCERMLSGAEKAAWLNNPWTNQGLLLSASNYGKRASYTFGYCFGYIGEQVFVGALTAGGSKIGQVLKQGAPLAGNIILRTAGICAVRMHWVKRVLTDLSLLDEPLELAYSTGMRSSGKHPVNHAIKETPVEVMQQTVTRNGFDGATYNSKILLDAATANGSNLRKLASTPGGYELLQRRTKQLSRLLGDEVDANTMKKFLDVAEERLVITRSDGQVDEYFEGFFRAFEANPAALHNLNDPAHSIAIYSPQAKARLKQFLSDPDAGNLWKIDDPIWGPDGVPDIPHNYWTRGIIAELDVYYRQYKQLGYTHHPTAANFDFTGAQIVQIKSVGNPNGAISAMQKAIQRLVAADPTNQAPLRLHILKKPGTDGTPLKNALDDYILSNNLEDRLEILIEAYNIGPQ